MLTNETLLTFTEGADRLPRIRGKRIHSSALWRWSRKGVRGVRLESLLLGGRFFTSAEALERFGRALADAAKGDAPTPPRTKTRPARSRRKATDKARADLERAGI